MVHGWITYFASTIKLSLYILSTSLSLKQIGGYVSIALVGTVKFWLSVLIALGADYSMLEVFLSGSLGAFLGVWVFTFFGTQIRKWIVKRLPKRKPMSFARRRKIYTFWKKFGLWGVAFLGPFISPPVAVGIAVSFREKPSKIIFSMTVSIVFWTLLFTVFRDTLLDLAGKI